MVRRSTVDHSPQPDLYSTGYDAETGSQPQRSTGKRPRSGSGWRGAGGRWLVWTFRVVVWAVLLIVGYRGVMAIVLNETPPRHTPAAHVARAPRFPVQMASAYALQFGGVYLNASPATASQRASELASFLPPGASDPQLGWNGGGSLVLQSAQVAGVLVEDAQHALVTLLARVNGKMMELGVPVYAAAGGLGISGEPAWLPAPKPAAVAGLFRRLRDGEPVHPQPFPGARHLVDRPRRLGPVRLRHWCHSAGRRYRPSRCCHRDLGNSWATSTCGQLDGQPRDGVCADHSEAAWHLVRPEHCPLYRGGGAAVMLRPFDSPGLLITRNPPHLGVGRCLFMR